MTAPSGLKVVSLPLSRLVVDPANARRHPARNLATIKGSLRRFGQQKPIVIDANDVIRAGNGTYEAARELGWESIACVRTKLQGSEAMAYSVADNRSADLAEWDDPALAAILVALQADDIPLEDVGYDDAELEAILRASGANILGGSDDDDDDPPPPIDQAELLRAKWGTEPGQLWVIPSRTDLTLTHRIVCGDAGDPQTVARLMDGGTAQLLMTSPPYANQRTYRSPVGDWDTLMQRVFSVVPMSDDGQLIVNLAHHHEEGEWVDYWRDWVSWMGIHGWKRIGWYVWDQLKGIPGETYGRLRRCHEFLFHFGQTTRDPVLTVECSEPGREEVGSGLRNPEGIGQRAAGCTKVWINGTHRVHDSVFHVSRQNTADAIEHTHPAIYPIRLCREILPIWPGTVYDPFGGSGTTLVAAEREKMPCRMIELAPEYVAVILERLVRMDMSPKLTA